MTALLPDVQEALAREIADAGGREVYFVGEVSWPGDECTITSVRAVARGTLDEVLALPGVAEKGMIVLHNHPSGELAKQHQPQPNR